MGDYIMGITNAILGQKVPGKQDVLHAQGSWSKEL